MDVRTVRALGADRLRSIQSGPKFAHFGVGRSVCTADRPGLRAELSAVLTREGLSLHMSLCACADCLVEVGGPSAGAKMDLGRNCVFLGVYIAYYLVFEPEQY